MPLCQSVMEWAYLDKEELFVKFWKSSRWINQINQSLGNVAIQDRGTVVC